MVINIRSVQYNGGFLPDIILLTQGYYTIREPGQIPCSGFVFIAYVTVYYYYLSTPVAQSAPRNLLTRWDVSSIPANGIFLTKN